MGRLAAITAFALFLAVPLWAQHGGSHGGGHAGGGGHASFGGGHAGGGGGFGSHSSGSGGGHVSSPSGGFGAHIASGARENGEHFSSRSSLPIDRGFSQPLPQLRSFSRNSYLQGRFAGPRFGSSYRGPYRYYPYGGYGPGCYGYGCWGYGWGYPWWYSSLFYDPWWWWDSDSSYDNSYQQDLANADAMNQQNLQEQQMLQQEQADGDQDAYSQQASERYQPEGAPILPATVLVFRDQHKEEVQNYAIVGQTLWNFSSPRTEKVPLSALDLPATVKANDDRGLSFKLPNGEAQ